MELSRDHPARVENVMMMFKNSGASEYVAICRRRRCMWQERDDDYGFLYLQMQYHMTHCDKPERGDPRAHI